MMQSIRILTGLNGTILLFYSVAAFFIVPTFVKLFEDFGTELPLATRIVLETYHYWWLIPLVFLAQFLLLRFGPERGLFVQKSLLVINIFFVILEVLFIPAMVFIFYLPIFAMGSVV